MFTVKHLFSGKHATDRTSLTAGYWYGSGWAVVDDAGKIVSHSLHHDRPTKRGTFFLNVYSTKRAAVQQAEYMNSKNQVPA